MSGFSLRPFQHDDQAEVSALHRSALEAERAWVTNGPWDDDIRNINGSYFENGGTFIVGILDGQLVAMGALRRIMPAVAEIKRMRVLPQFQRRGYGQRIYDALELGCEPNKSIAS